MRYGANPGLAAYQPPPATVIPDMPTRAVAEYHQAPPPVEIRSRPEQPRTTVPASTGAPAPTRALASTGVPAADEALASSGAFASTEPAAAAAASRNQHSVGVRKPTHSRSSPPLYPGYAAAVPRAFQ